MRELTLRTQIIKKLKCLDAISVENAAHSGTPDINYVEGWIELKWEPNWPIKATTPLRVRKFQPQQRAWIMRRARLGGSVYLLLRVEKTWLLFPGLWAAINLGLKTKSELLKGAIGHWERNLPEEELVKILKIGKEIGEQ